MPFSFVRQALESPPADAAGVPRVDVAWVRARRLKTRALPAVSERWAVPLAPGDADAIARWVERNTPEAERVIWRIEWTNGAGEAIPGGRQATVTLLAPSPAPSAPPPPDDDGWTYRPVPSPGAPVMPHPPAAPIVVEPAPSAPLTLSPGEVPIPSAAGSGRVDPEVGRKLMGSGDPMLVGIGAIVLAMDRTAAVYERALSDVRTMADARCADGRAYAERAFAFAERVQTTAAGESQGLARTALGSAQDLARTVATARDAQLETVGDLVGQLGEAHKAAADATARATIAEKTGTRDTDDEDEAAVRDLVKLAGDVWGTFRTASGGGSGLLRALGETYAKKQFEPLFSYLDTAPKAEVDELERFMFALLPKYQEWSAARALKAAAGGAA